MTNKNASHFTMETTKLETRKWHGLVHRDINYLTNVWFSEDGKQLTVADITNTRVSPIDVMVAYNTGASEIIFMPDDLDALVIDFISPSANRISSQPTFAMRIDYYASSNIDAYQVLSDPDGTVYVKAANTKYIAVVTNGGIYQEGKTLLPREFAKDDLRNDGSSIENVFSPGSINLQSNSIMSSAGLGDTKHQAKDIALNALNNYEQLREEKAKRIQHLLDENYFIGNLNNREKEVDLATSVAWALVSIDKLQMKRFGEGLYAGFHWFDDYWARDTFISFKGALLSTGNWEFARQTLRTMANLQLNDSQLYAYGRVPNRVSMEGSPPDYSTADGTGWFVKAVEDYVRLTNDIDFAIEMIPHVELALLGEESRMDELGLVTHLDRETWMDAQTNNFIHTPRGNRAVEIQALLYKIFDVIQFLYQFTGRESTNLLGWQTKQAELLKQIDIKYWNPAGGLLLDHLQSNDFPSTEKRPNQFLALSLLPKDFLKSYEYEDIINKNRDLITQAGVRTLNPADPSYRGTHDGGNWNHDNAYHNGDIWPWLSGALIELLLRIGDYESATNLITTLAIHVLEKNPVGGIGEIFDGDASGYGESVGALFQLWSLAEFIRSITFLLSGFEADPQTNTLHFNPVGMNILREFTCTQHYRDSVLQFSAIKSDNSIKISISNISEDTKLSITVPKLFSKKNIDIQPSSTNFRLQDDPTLPNKYEVFEIQPVGDSVTLTITNDTSTEIPSSKTKSSKSLVDHPSFLLLLPLFARWMNLKKTERMRQI
ncbi:MAG: amylo-alpha-1,6-glucosidase [Candidatus Kariarchaeaceae archaeon]